MRDEMAEGPLQVYVDTSVFGGAFDREFEQASQAFFARVRMGAFRMTISALVVNELEQAPEVVKRLFEEFEPLVARANLDERAFALRRAYLDAHVVGPQFASDALHVAAATVSGCRAIVSWNFKHIVNFRRISLYNEVNRMEGHGPIAIHTPMEVIFDDEDEEGL